MKKKPKAQMYPILYSIVLHEDGSRTISLNGKKSLTLSPEMVDQFITSLSTIFRSPGTGPTTVDLASYPMTGHVISHL